MIVLFIVVFFTFIITGIANHLDKINFTLQESKESLMMALFCAQAGTWNWNLITDKIIPDKRCREMFDFKDGDSCENLDDYLKKIHPIAVLLKCMSFQ